MDPLMPPPIRRIVLDREPTVCRGARASPPGNGLVDRQQPSPRVARPALRRSASACSPE